MQKNLAYALLLLAFMATPALADDHDDKSTLEITAEVSVKADPDVASISAGVLSTAPTAAAALSDNAKSMTAVYEALKKAGIPAKDIQTAGLNISPQYNYANNEAPKVTGYQASNTVNVILRDLKNTGATIDALVSQGANQINGPTFSVENPDSLLDDARAEAVKKSRARAEIFAKAAGMKIKRVLSMTESLNTNPPPRPMMAMRAAKAAADVSSPVSAGEIDLSVSVTVKYELAE